MAMTWARWNLWPRFRRARCAPGLRGECIGPFSNQNWPTSVPAHMPCGSCGRWPGWEAQCVRILGCALPVPSANLVPQLAPPHTIPIPFLQSCLDHQFSPTR